MPVLQYARANPTGTEAESHVLLSGNPQLVTAYQHEQKRDSLASAQIRERSSTQDRLKSKLTRLVTSHDAWAREYARTGAPLPKAENDQKLAEIRLRREQLNMPDTNQQIWPCDMDELDQFVVRNHKRLNETVPALDFDTFDVEPETYDKAFAATDALRQDLGKAINAARPKHYCRESVIAEIDARIKAGKPSLRDIRNPVDYSQRLFRFEINRSPARILWPKKYTEEGREHQSIDAFGLLMWLHGDQIKKKLLAEIDAYPNEGIPPSEKAANVNEVYQKIADALRYECAVARALETKGNWLARRRTYHPSVILEISASPAAIAEYV